VPEFPFIRVYLDANVLFSSTHAQHSRFTDFWKLRNVGVFTSQYAVGEVSRNIENLEHRLRFESILAQTQFVSDADVRLIPSPVYLVAKDAPILSAAISASVDYHATGDQKHFAHLFNTMVAGVRVVRPTEFLRIHHERLLK
jgi:predicted nucleic acid-binding protein